MAESLVPVLTCFGTEPWCGSPFVTGVGWLRPPSKVATGQDSCRGWSEGFCLVPAAAGSAHSSPGGWRGLNCRMARELIRNAGKKLVPFLDGLPPHLFFFSFLVLLVLCMGRGIHNLCIGTSSWEFSDMCPTSRLHPRKGTPRVKCFSGWGGPSSLLPPCPFELL